MMGNISLIEIVRNQVAQYINKNVPLTEIEARVVRDILEFLRSIEEE